MKMAHEQDRLFFADLLQYFDVARVTLFRDIQALIQNDKLSVLSKWVYQYKRNTLDYLDLPFYDRKEVLYNFSFLGSYNPNHSYFLSKEQRKVLHDATKHIGIDTDYYKQNRRLIENVLIDLSFASSNLEWNTYSYLDTEVLVKYNEIADDKTKEDTQMVLNHKKCIEYMIYYKHELWLNKQSFKEVHTLLWTWLLQDEYLGTIRNKLVEIGQSKYKPLDNNYQLTEQFELFLEKLDEIKNPFEQSVFILVFIPYFQLFMDINKRTSRMMCNLPLFKHNLPLLSLLQVKKIDYITSILAVYECNDVDLLTELYVKNYLLNMHRYSPNV